MSKNWTSGLAKANKKVKHNSETRIMKIQKLVMQEFGIPAAIAVHGVLTKSSPSVIRESHGKVGSEALEQLQSEYNESLEAERK